jgi:hypothetical protein
MLSAPDADLVRRETALPGLATLLDPDAFAAVLRDAALARWPDEVRVTYVRYKPGTSCLVGYRVESAGAVDLAFATAHRADAGAKWAKEASACRVILNDRAVFVRLFPDDDGLAVLRRLAEPAGRAVLLKKMLPGRPDLWEGALEALRYKPRRRYVGLLSVGGQPQAVLKAHTADGYDLALANARAIRSSPCLPPRRLGRSRRHRLLAFEWRSGLLLSGGGGGRCGGRPRQPARLVPDRPCPAPEREREADPAQAG